MSDEFGRKKVEQSWEPGTLDATRRAIGPIDKEEAVRMTKLLGGEILQEKSAPIDYSAFPQKEYRLWRVLPGSRLSGIPEQDLFYVFPSFWQSRRNNPYPERTDKFLLCSIQSPLLFINAAGKSLFLYKSHSITVVLGKQAW